MADLVVELYGRQVGTLIGTDWRSFDFAPSSDAFEHFELGSTILSAAVPLLPRQPRGRAERRRNFFAGLLPEGSSLDDLAQRAKVTTSDAIGLLRRYGRDVAGAVQIWDPDDPTEPRTPTSDRLTRGELEVMLSDLSAQPLGNKPLQGKSSLAGVQAKAVVASIDGQWHQVLDGYPSTHLIKPEPRDDPHVIYDEEYGSRLARALDLLDYDTHIEEFGSITGLVIERYDRSDDMPQGRLHQEDMNQALGVAVGGKYQERGSGQMSLRRIAELFGSTGDTASLRRLSRATVLAVAVGNLDMHGKNLSIVHPLDDEMSMAPVYDMVPLAHRADLDGRMALSVDGVYPHAAITRDDLVDEAAAWGLRDAGDVVDETLAAIDEAISDENPDARASPGVHDDIGSFTRHLRAGRPAGRPPSVSR